jgi:glycine/D-amino acid oxidase-like deaminating enzyme
MGYETLDEAIAMQNDVSQGLTYAATCARLMGQLVTGEGPELDLHPYRIDRF